MFLFFLNSGILRSYIIFYCISSCCGIINSLVLSPGNSDPRGTSESTASVSVMNVAYFAQKLIEKLSSRMFAADPKQILLFTAKQIMGVSHMKDFFKLLSTFCLFHTEMVIRQISRSCLRSNDSDYFCSLAWADNGCKWQSARFCWIKKGELALSHVTLSAAYVCIAEWE